MKSVSNSLRIMLMAFVFGALIFTCTRCQNSSKELSAELEEGFTNPPDEAKPRVWWHWMNGNVTIDGIQKDLDWMSRSGIGGFQNFDAGMTTPQIVEQRLIYMTPEWKDAFRFTAELADSLNLEMAIAGSPGWSESGGPWVTPKEAMKKYVWSETQIEGGSAFSGILPHPPTATGSFQNVEAGRGGGFGSSEEVEETPHYYADAAVIAYRIPDGELSLDELQPRITSSGGNFNLQTLTDGDVVTSTLLPSAPVGQNAWLQFEFDTPQTIQSLTIATAGGGGRGFGRGSDSSGRTLEVSDDGVTFNKVIDITSGRVAQNTISFAPVTGKYFRLSILTPEPSPAPQGGMGGMFGGNSNQNTAPSGTQIAEFVLHTGAYVNRFEDKAGFAAVTEEDLAASATPDVSNAISKDDVIDLTAQMQSDGTLNWTAPAGKWKIVRIGYTLTGHQNSPASPEATGLEVDKLNPDYVSNYFNNYLDQYTDATGGLIGQHGLQYIITDSWEAGTANWTDNMMSEFTTRRGYDITPWMPVLAGHVVESAEASDRFLWDFIRTLEELVAEYHYDNLTDILNQRDMKGRYTESHEGGRAFIGDGMEVKRTAAVPMSATWTPGGFGGSGPDVAVRHKADVRESASVSHIYGQKYVAAESLTAIGTAWAWSPELLKPVADAELSNGLNRFVIHTSVHQPVDDKIPGLGLGPFGQWFTRHETWAEQAIAWTTYLARSSYMLQQGDNVADVAYMYGEENNITALFGSQLPPVPQGYEFDFLNADALVHVLEVNDGNITSPAGASYKILALDPSTAHMSLPVLQKIQAMVEAGAVVTGPKPQATPSNSDDLSIFNEVVNELWANENGVNSIGAGKVYAGYSIQEVLGMENVVPDFTYTKPQDDTNVLYVHHTLGDIDFYWVNNRNDRVENIEATFRIDGKEAEIWHPETGMIEDASYSIEDGLTSVPLKLQPSDAVFVVFRTKAKGNSRTVAQPQEEVVSTVSGPWEVSFVSKVGTPFQSTFETLTPWNENADEEIKYFSGDGTYTKTINVPAEWLADGKQVYIDLGDVENLAEVSVNGQDMGITWKKPFRLDITKALTEGENTLEIKVVNLWVNRLIGDQQPDVTEKLTYTTQDFYNADSPLKPSGLLGPVEIVSVTK